MVLTGGGEVDAEGTAIELGTVKLTVSLDGRLNILKLDVTESETS